jgi:hypothetical protein
LRRSAIEPSRARQEPTFNEKIPAEGADAAFSNTNPQPAPRLYADRGEIRDYQRVEAELGFGQEKIDYTLSLREAGTCQNENHSIHFALLH